MKTDELINALSADNAVQLSQSEARNWTRGLAAGAAAAVLMVLMIVKARPDIGEAIHDPRFLFKFVAALALAGPAAALAYRLSRPQSGPGPGLAMLVLAPALLALGCGIDIALTPASGWGAQATGNYPFYCLVCVPVFSLAPLTGIFLALSQGAPTHQRLAGFVGGLAAGGMGAAAYALHCTDDSPLFLALWYSIAVTLVGALGAWLGPRVLRW